jgi:hypothetical protein
MDCKHNARFYRNVVDDPVRRAGEVPNGVLGNHAGHVRESEALLELLQAKFA